MADARTIGLVDKLVAVVKAAWNPAGDDAVSREYLARAADDLPTLKGRKVFFFPGPYGQELENRREDLGSYKVGAVVIERYADDDPPTSAAAKAWLDERVEFVESELYDGLDYTGRDPLLVLGTRRFWTQAIEVVSLYDADLWDQKSVFRCDIGYEFRELIT